MCLCIHLLVLLSTLLRTSNKSTLLNYSTANSEGLVVLLGEAVIFASFVFWGVFAAEGKGRFPCQTECKLIAVCYNALLLCLEEKLPFVWQSSMAWNMLHGLKLKQGNRREKLRIDKCLTPHFLSLYSCHLCYLSVGTVCVMQTLDKQCVPLWKNEANDNSSVSVC